MHSSLRGALAGRLIAASLTCALIAGCSGGTGPSSGAAPLGAGKSGIDQSALGRLNLPVLKLGPNGNVNPHKFTPVAVPYIGSSSRKRSPKATVQTANEQQTTGLAFSANDAQGAQTNDLNFLGTAYTGAQMNLPNPTAGTNYLISPDTVVGADSCIELKTVYYRNAGDTGTTAQMHVFDSCTQTEYNIATIDATFASTYTHDYGSGPQYYADVKKVGATWQVFLNNFTTSLFDSYYTAPGTATPATGGQSTFNINTFAVGKCPSLQAQVAEAFQIATVNGTGPAVWSTMAPTSSAGGTPDCFNTGVSTNPYYYYVRFGNADPAYAKWAVYTSSAAPSPSPTPSPTPTATPTATPTPVPTATPTPTPVPTATPTPNPRIWVVTQNTTTMTAHRGTTTVFPCWVSIHTYDNIEERIMVVDGTLSTAFPMMQYPTPSYVSWAVPDFSPAYTLMNNTRSNLQRLYMVLRGLDQTHCVDLSIVVPSTQALGTYPSDINYSGLARTSPTGSLYVTYGHTDVSFNLVVIP